MKHCNYDSRGQKYTRRQFLLTIMLTRLWDVKVVVNLAFVLPGVTINSDSYVGSRGRGSAVVMVQRYKSEGRWFDSRWCHWNFSLT